MALLIENRQKKIKVDLRQLRRSANKVLDELCCRDRELSLLLVDNKEIKDINRQYLNRDCPTNVISFSQIEGEFGNLNPKILGDIVISVEKAQSDADEGGLSLEDGIDYLFIHGILHLTGYNHENTTEAEALKMQNRANELFFLLKGYRIE
ncbi:MAG TPA: rRNA maturation RNase YbeY [Syntrophales bacterium]|nr:rRNA maturation RNase YbeY [Syntrophales bacterium]